MRLISDRSGRRPGRLSAALSAGLLLSVSWTSGWAHHSATAFDQAHPATLTGTVKDFRWGNPHTWIDVLVPNGSGGQDVWSLESSSVNVLVRQGWNSQELKPGMKVVIVIAPDKDGGHAGRVLSVLDIDDQPFHPTPPAP